ncbi:hypothetical protein NLO98_16920 [Pseudomonas syringae]|nr:hypothetical protein [Pseudomonas syringae]
MNAWTSPDAKGTIRFMRKLMSADEMAKNKPNQGARKTETLTLRLDPKIKLMIELISRIRRQSITGVVEAAIDEIAFDLDAPFVLGGEAHTISLGSAVSEIWSTDESERFINLCHFLPSLITYEEQRIWETIKASKYFLVESDDDLASYWEVPQVGRINRYLLRHWWTDLLNHVEDNKESRTIVPFNPGS